MSVDYITRLIQGGVNRIMALRNYKPTYEYIKSQLVLFKPTEVTYKTDLEDFGLSRISKKTVPVYTLEGNHSTIIGNEELTKVINAGLVQ